MQKLWNKKITLRNWALPLLLSLSACGGGGGGGGSGSASTTSNMPNGDAASFTPSQLTASFVAGTTQPLQVQANIKRPADFGAASTVYALVKDTTGVITTSVSLTPSSNTIYRATLNTSPDIAPGHYTGFFTVMLCRDSACNTQFPGSPMGLPFDITVTPPTLGVKADAANTEVMVRAGDVPPAPQQFNVSGKYLNWTASTSAPWVTLSSASGTGPATVKLSYSADGLKPGKYSDTVKVSTSDGQSVSLPVSITVLPHKLLAAENGVALTSTPGGSRLSRTIIVRDNLDKSNIPWTAQSNQAWLTVTASGVTGQALTLSANSASLPSDTLSYATVTLRSSDPTITMPEAIQVALWKGSRMPSSTMTLATTITDSELIADPIRPYAYVHNSGNTIDVYNVYTGTKVAMLSTAGATFRAMAIAPDGATLYAHNVASNTIEVFDLMSLTHTGSWPAIGARNGYLDTPGMLVIRPDGVNVVVLGNSSNVTAQVGTAYVAATGKSLGDQLPYGLLAATADGRFFYALNPYSHPFHGARYKVEYTDAGDGSIRFTSFPGGTFDFNAQVEIDGKGIAVSADGKQLYATTFSDLGCSSFNPTDLHYLGSLGRPDNGDTYFSNIVKIGSDGRVYCGVWDAYNKADVWVHRADGTLQGSFKFAGYSKRLLDRQMAISGDGMMLIGLTNDPLLVFVPVGQ
jgi:hypothetical protein